MKEIETMKKKTVMNYHNLCTTPLCGTTVTSIVKMSTNNKTEKNEKN